VQVYHRLGPNLHQLHPLCNMTFMQGINVMLMPASYRRVSLAFLRVLDFSFSLIWQFCCSYSYLCIRILWGKFYENYLCQLFGCKTLFYK